MIWSMFRQFLYTNFNTLLFVLSFGRYHWLEGRLSGGRFHNWSHQFRFKPAAFEQPSSEEAIVALIKRHEKIRVVGAGHSFNPAFVTDHVLLSLDCYAGIIAIDREKKEVTVRGGTRIRDLSRMLWKAGLALIALPSHDAQSVAGLLSTDTHGAGREWGFVSQSVRQLKIVTGRCEVLECGPGEDLFRAAIGGIGAVGVIIEVTLSVVERFNVVSTTKIVEVEKILANLADYRASHEHFSLYMFPFSRKCQVNTWDRTEKRQTFLGSFLQNTGWGIEALLATTVGNASVLFRFLPYFATAMTVLRPRTSLVLRSYVAFHHTLYYVSQSMEFAVPQEKTIEVWRQLNELYERTFQTSTTPFALFDLRFTPGGHDGTLIGPGRDRASTFIDLLSFPTTGYQELYRAAEDILRAADARPHLGKYTGTFNADDLARLNGAYYETFVRMVARHDPDSKFQTDFSRRFMPSQPLQKINEDSNDAHAE